MHGGGASIRSNEGMSGDRPRKQGSESIFPTAGLERGCLPRPAGLPGACRAPQLRLDGRAEPVHLLLALVSGGVHSGEAGNATSAKLEKLSKQRSEEHTSELQSLMRNSYAVFCLKKKNKTKAVNKIKKDYST